MVLVDNDNIHKLIKQLQVVDSIGLDVEASSLDPHTATLLLIQIGLRNGENYIINAGKVDKKLITYALKLIRERQILCIGHNIKYDAKVLFHNYHVLIPNLFDTFLAEVIYQAGLTKPYWSLDELVWKYLGLQMDKEARNSFIDKHDFEFTQKDYEYAEKDVVVLHPIYDQQLQRIRSRGVEKVWEELERPLEPVIALMEYQGVAFDSTAWIALAEQAERDVKRYEREMLAYLREHFDELAGNYTNGIEAIDNLLIKKDAEGKAFTAKFRREAWSKITTKEEIISSVVPLINLSSPQQCVNILKRLIDRNIKSSAEQELKKHKGNPFVDLLLNYRESFKKATGFGREFLKYVNPSTGCIHTSLNQLGAATGRFSSDGPNLQNIIADKEYRHCFIAREGYSFMRLDFSQIELRMMAEVANEPVLIEAFQKGDDPHAITGAAIEEISLEDVTDDIRDRGKHVNFAVIYGTSEYGLNRNFGWPIEQGKVYLERFFNKYPQLDMFIKLCGLEVIKHGWSSTLFGRKRWFRIPDARDVGGINRVKRQGVNQIIQGTSTGDLIKLVILGLYQENPFGWENCRPVLTVHDEVVVEFRDDLKDNVVKFVEKVVLEKGQLFLKKIPVKYGYNIKKYWDKSDGGDNGEEES